MRLYHYTTSPVSEVRPCTQERSDGRKPVGLWVSDCDAGNGWRDWCRAEDFGDIDAQTRLAVDLEMNEILHLKTVWDIDEFTNAYSWEKTPSGYPATLIDWAAVARDYTGILISPYQWGRRLDGEASGWYYGWDCASGCIWSPRSVQSIQPEQSP